MILEEFYALMSHKDCGECGFSSCRTFARKLIRKTSKIEGCKHLNIGASKQINEILKCKKIILTKVSMTGKGMLVLQPCHSKGKRMAEFQIKPYNDLFGVFDLEALNTCISSCKDFTDIKKSINLGVITFSYFEKKVFVFSSGLVRVKQAKSQEDILNASGFILEKIIGSLILDDDELLLEHKSFDSDLFENSVWYLLNLKREGTKIKDLI
ncbi:MAG: hypothetical protein K0B02_01145 [DPANN group archaeon]|nr:hypothetical protein [DPANN group archaeon]